MTGVVAAIGKRLPGLRRKPFDNLLGLKLQRIGCPLRDWRALEGMAYEELVGELRAIAAGERSRFAFLERRAGDTQRIGQRIAGEGDSERNRFQRLFTGQIVQFLLWQKLVGMKQAEFDRWFAVDGLEKAEASVRAGKGVMLVASHFGQARLGPPLLARSGIDLTALVPTDFQDMLAIAPEHRFEAIELTDRPGMQALVQSQRLLRSGGVVHTTGDGLRGSRQEAYPFLDGQRPFAASFAHLALGAGAACHPVFVRADADGRIVMTIEPALTVAEGEGASPERIDAMVTAYARLLEERWRTDFGNVPAHSLRLYADGWVRNGPIED